VTGESPEDPAIRVDDHRLRTYRSDALCKALLGTSYGLDNRKANPQQMWGCPSSKIRILDELHLYPVKRRWQHYKGVHSPPAWNFVCHFAQGSGHASPHASATMSEELVKFDELIELDDVVRIGGVEQRAVECLPPSQSVLSRFCKQEISSRIAHWSSVIPCNVPRKTYIASLRSHNERCGSH